MHSYGRWIQSVIEHTVVARILCSPLLNQLVSFLLTRDSQLVPASPSGSTVIER